MTDVKKLVLKNYLLIPLANLLARQELKSNMSRARSRFIKTLAVRIEANEAARMEMIDKYVMKDEDGKPKTVNGNFDLGENQKAFNEEHVAFKKEDTVFDVLPSNEKDFELVGGIIRNTEEKFSSNSSPDFNEFEEIYEAFELIK